MGSKARSKGNRGRKTDEPTAKSVVQDKQSQRTRRDILLNLLLIILGILTLLISSQQVVLGHHSIGNEHDLQSNKSNLRSIHSAKHASKEVRRRPPSRLNPLLYITTAFSDDHTKAFKFCWPTLLKSSSLIQRASVIVFSYNNTKVEESVTSDIQDLFDSNPSFEFKFASPTTLNDIYRPSNRGGWMADHPLNIDQVGPNEAVHLGFSNGWFAPFSWVVRVKPDTLIRNSTWLLKTMQDPMVDGIFVECAQNPTPRIHTDFFAVRPKACRPNAFDEILPEYSGPHQGNHERTAHYEFKPIMDASRHRWLPDNDDSKTICRVRGQKSSVTHFFGEVKGDMCSELKDFPIS